MTIRHLKIFIAVAETGKMSSAAEKLYLSQPTVSQAIRELEEHYHILLFERLSKRLYITVEGKQLLTYARQVVEQFDALEEKMIDAGGRERLRIGVTLTIGSCIMPTLIRRFEEKCPMTDLYTCVGNTKSIEEKLLEAELDVAVVEGMVRSAELVSSPVVKDCLVLACGRQHPLAAKRELTAEDLRGQKFVMRKSGSGTRMLLENYLAKRGISIDIKIEADCIEMIQSAIIENGCLAVVSVRLLEHAVRKGKVCIFYNESGEWDRTFKLVYHKNKHVTPSMKSLGSMLADYEEPVFKERMGVIR